MSNKPRWAPPDNGETKCFCMSDLTEEEREAFVNSIGSKYVRDNYEKQKSQGAFNPPPKCINPMDEMKEEMKKLYAEIEKLKKKNA